MRTRCQEVGDPTGYYTRLAAPGTREDEERPIAVCDGFALSFRATIEALLCGGRGEVSSCWHFSDASLQLSAISDIVKPTVHS